MFSLFNIKVFTRHDGSVFWQIQAFNPKNGNWHTKSFDEKPKVDTLQAFLKDIDPDITFLSL